MRKQVIVAIGFIFITAISCVQARGEWLVIEKPGEVRSGPAITSTIIEKAKLWDVFEVPSSFTIKENTKWIPIESEMQKEIYTKWINEDAVKVFLVRRAAEKYANSEIYPVCHGISSLRFGV